MAARRRGASGPRPGGLSACLPAAKIGRVIPVAVVTGPVGVGKSTVLREADSLLVAAGIPHATVEFEDLARYWGRGPGEQRTRPDVAYQNLAAVWANYRAAGADRLLLSFLMERLGDLDPVHAVIADARITVVRLQAPLAVIEERLRFARVDRP